MTPNPPPVSIVNLDDLIGTFRKPGHAPGVEPRDSAKFMSSVAQLADLCADEVARKSNCGCKLCALALRQAKVAAFMCKETLTAALTGDTSKLDAVLARVEELKAAR